VEGRNASAGQSSGGASYSNNNYNNNTAPQPAAAAGDGFMNIPDGIDEELPFN
jgi:single-strand DNA-binding protein